MGWSGADAHLLYAPGLCRFISRWWVSFCTSTSVGPYFTPTTVCIRCGKRWLVFCRLFFPLAMLEVVRRTCGVGKGRVVVAMGPGSSPAKVFFYGRRWKRW